MKETEKFGGLEKLVNANGNEVKLKDMVKKGQLEEISVKEAVQSWSWRKNYKQTNEIQC